MSRSTYETAIRAWLVAVTGLAQAKVIPADDHGARPAKPYVTYKINGRSPEGMSHERRSVTEGGTVQATINREHRLFVGLQAFGSGAWDLLCQAQDSLGDVDATAGLDAAGLACWGVNDVQSVPSVLPGANQFEERAALDVEFGCRSSRVADQGVIETVGMTLTTDLADGSEIEIEKTVDLS